MAANDNDNDSTCTTHRGIASVETDGERPIAQYGKVGIKAFLCGRCDKIHLGMGARVDNVGIAVQANLTVAECQSMIDRLTVAMLASRKMQH